MCPKPSRSEGPEGIMMEAFRLLNIIFQSINVYPRTSISNDSDLNDTTPEAHDGLVPILRALEATFM